MSAAIEPLAIDGAWVITPKQFTDHRGAFLEWFRQDLLEATVGHPLDLRQANASVSAAGVVRGIHFADVPPGQAKYVTCLSGSVLDVVVDLREGSATFGQWDSVLLDTTDRRAVYIAEGLGHAFMALAESSTVAYLCSTSYAPEREHGINPFDPAIGIEWPEVGGDAALAPITSPKDTEAPSLEQARVAGLLPDAQATADYVQELRRRFKSARDDGSWSSFFGGGPENDG